jgi:hypothetical protein
LTGLDSLEGTIMADEKNKQPTRDQSSISGEQSTKPTKMSQVVFDHAKRRTLTEERATIERKQAPPPMKKKTSD